MKLLNLLEDDRAEKHAVWDELVSDLPEDHPLMPAVDFVANVYNGGLAGTILERNHRLTIRDAITSLTACKLSPSPEGLEQLNWLITSLKELEHKAQYFIDEYRRAGPDEEDENPEAIMDQLDQDSEVQEVENWIYDDANMTPIFRRMIACK